MIKLNNNRLFIIYDIVIAIIASLLSTVLNITSAITFDRHYFTLMIISIALFSVLFNEPKGSLLFKKHLVIGTTVGAVASVVFYILDNTNYYFTFEMEGYTWIGLGILRILFYFLLSSTLGMILWLVKLAINKFIDSVSND